MRSFGGKWESLGARTTAWAVALLLLVAAVPPAAAQGGDPNACDAPGDEPDVIVGNLHQHERYGSVDGITAFSLGTVSCNVGTCWLNWNSSPSNQHPVIGQNMYRLKDGRFEQLGQSWLKHGFFALSQQFCSPDCVGTNGDHLGVNCSDPYSSFLNGDQDRLGPKFEVDASAGSHPHPVTDQSLTGDAIFKRLQVHNDDLDPLLNPGALYFVEGHYVAEDDAAADNQNNNASYRKITVNGSSGFFDIDFDGPTQQELAGIRAWAIHDTGVDEVDIQVPGDGLFMLGAKVTDLGNGTWHYEYAIQNLNSHRSAASFSVPIPDGTTVTHIGFHDVDYHSGEPFDGTDWSDNGGSSYEVAWSTIPFDQDENANALRWGTLYNFRFDADVEPALNDVTLGLFRPGVPMEITATTWTPRICNANGTCDPGEDCGRCAIDCADGTCDPGEDTCNCAEDCGLPTPEELCRDAIDNDCDQMVDCFDPDCCADAACAPPDIDGDTFAGCLDCVEDDGDLWATPGEVHGLILAKGPSGTVLSWNPPAEPGATTVAYDVLRATNPASFLLETTCVAGLDVFATTRVDSADPAVGMFAYLVRATNGCPKGAGDLGAGTNGPRVGRPCS
jgi:hypothetical protein